MLKDRIMDKFRKAFDPLKGCYVLPYYNEKFDIQISENNASMIAEASEIVIDEILNLLDSGTLTKESFINFQSEVHEKHKNDELYKNNKNPAENPDVIFFLTDGFYNGGPYQRPAFERATKLIGRANGDDVNSTDWKVILQTQLYATIFTIMGISLDILGENVPDICGWKFFCNCMNTISGLEKGQMYHIKIGNKENIDTIEEFKKELKKYLLKDEVWQFTEDQIRIYEKGYTGADDDEAELIKDTNAQISGSESETILEDTLVIKIEKGTKISHSRHLVSGLYSFYQTGGWNMVHKEISQSIEHLSEVVVTDLDKLLSDYETAKTRLIMRPKNYSKNRLNLRDHVYTLSGDIALILYFVISDYGKGLTTAEVPKSIFESWGVKLEDVVKDALDNNMLQAQPRIYTNPMDIKDSSYTKGAFMALNSSLKSIPGRGAIITTSRRNNGAISLFYPGVKEKIGEICQDDFYVVFTSTTEAWIHPAKSSSPRMLLQGLKNNNKRFPADMLSKKVFFYNRSTNEFKPLEL